MKFLFWVFYFPLVSILGLFLSWLPEIQVRRKFEKKNHSEDNAKSFLHEGKKASVCFEFSSEGEYQQVASLIDDALKTGLLIELVFFSPSVEKTVLELSQRYPTQIRYQRFAILTKPGFLNWVTAPKLVMVRYDLFPEFLVWAREDGHELILVWMTFKKERMRGTSVSLMKKIFLKSASKIIYASVLDEQDGRAMGLSGSSYDFRIEQIRRRVEGKEVKFQRNFLQYDAFKASLERFPREKRLLIGNAWPSDLFLFKEIPEDYFVAVIPHQLSHPILSAFEAYFSALGREVVVINEAGSLAESDTFVINRKGILCELYADFGKAYVGGGFEAGVHSLLEPLVAGVDTLACGVKTQRSTEFDVAKSFNKVTEIKSSYEMLDWLKRQVLVDDNRVKLKAVFESYPVYRKEVISC